MLGEVLAGFAVALGCRAWFSYLYSLPFGAVDWPLAGSAAKGLGGAGA